MKTRNEILIDVACSGTSHEESSDKRLQITIEVLLDIRQLLWELKSPIIAHLEQE